MKKLYTLILLISIIWIGCGGSDNQNQPKASKEIDYPHLAEAYCACAKNTISINNELKAIMENGSNADFEALLPEADKAFKEAMGCCKKARNGNTTEVDQQKIIKPLKSICPDLPPQLLLKMVTEIK